MVPRRIGFWRPDALFLKFRWLMLALMGGLLCVSQFALAAPVEEPSGEASLSCAAQRYQYS